jgi:hypothetical protein
VRTGAAAFAVDGAVPAVVDSLLRDLFLPLICVDVADESTAIAGDVDAELLGFSTSPAVGATTTATSAAVVVVANSFPSILLLGSLVVSVFSWKESFAHLSEDSVVVPFPISVLLPILLLFLPKQSIPMNSDVQ